MSEFSVDSLREFALAALAASGVPEDDAALTAYSLVQADQRGIASHGLLRLPLYVRAPRNRWHRLGAGDRPGP
ncbi:Ldh family oxidoreductase [Brevibacterium casei]|uniref:Ldh family oxidoreductase n=1 Tax=Brevibacterium casei TaxID=33889 RepID=UPI0031598D6B